jgi:protein transport protein SEC13
MVTIDNAHDDLIHDAVLDYYGKRLATASSDKTIKIFEVDGTEHRLAETLRGHDGPVWQVSWAHPKFGVILASASYDGKVLIWREEQGRWSIISEHTVHQASVNSVSWAPHEYGAQLLVTSSDGKISIVEYKEDGSTSSIVIDRAHAIGANSATWAPPLSTRSSNDASLEKQQERRFVSGGSDNLVKIWKFSPAEKTYELEHTLEGHTDWVRDVAWSPSVLVKSYIASASQDRTVIIWSQEKPGGEWKKQLLQDEKFPDVVWRASWSLSGNILAISGGDNKVTLWRENLDGKWEPAGQIDE